MSFQITENCVKCGKCFEICPWKAIKENKDDFYIATELCADCGSCASICENSAIVPEHYKTKFK
ncbi:MAG: 4Fe-4S binding protein [Planctomycetes bacterium]|nr:4Fe-4S binding protein [Planctomycetota bacterium]